MRKYRQYTDNDIINYAKEVNSISGLLRKLDIKPVGGNFINIKRNIQRLNVDTSHWTGHAWNKNQQLKDWSQYAKVGNCKKHLIKLKGNQCENCKLFTWQGFDITLEVHHIDGNRTNNQLENLQLLCCNCHSITDNWRNKKTKTAV